MNIGILCAQYGSAGLINGAQLGATILKQASLKCNNTIDIGTVLLESKSNNNIESQIRYISNELAIKIEESLLKNIPVLTVGGDHSIALGTIVGASKAANKVNKNMGVIYIDAHTDINTPESSHTGNYHGMPLAFAMGLGNSALSKLISKPLLPQNLLYIGSRSIDPPEKKLVDDLNIRVILSDDIKRYDTSLSLIYSQVYNFVKENNIERIHLSIDIDVVDPFIAPGTGVPEPNGISNDIFQKIIKHIITEYNVFTVDFVEFNPLLDRNKATEQICCETCVMIIKTLLHRYKNEPYQNI